MLTVAQGESQTPIHMSHGALGNVVQVPVDPHFNVKAREHFEMWLMRRGPVATTAEECCGQTAMSQDTLLRIDGELFAMIPITVPAAHTSGRRHVRGWLLGARSKGIFMPTRKAHARWEGTLKEGKGTVDFGNGLFSGAYSFTSRFENGAGTNPEELLAAAHAGCFAMALSLVLGLAGFTPDYVDATAHVTVKPQDGGFKITKSKIACEAKVRGLNQAAFAKHAETARANCPVSQALAGIEITLDARLVPE